METLAFTMYLPKNRLPPNTIILLFSLPITNAMHQQIGAGGASNLTPYSFLFYTYIETTPAQASLLDPIMCLVGFMDVKVFAPKFKIWLDSVMG